MPQNRLTALAALNRQRRNIRGRMGRDAKGYAATSAKMLSLMEKLHEKELSAFLKKNPDFLLDAGVGVAARLGRRAKSAALSFLKDARAKGGSRVRLAGKSLETKGLDMLKRALSL